MKQIFIMCAIFLSTLAMAQDWTNMNSGTTENLTKVYFVNDNVGFIIGENGTLLRTADGGSSWTNMNTGVSHNLTTISFLNENVGFINGLKTTDGGNNWTVQTETKNFDVLIAFANNNLIGGNPTNGYQGEIHKSTDGGLTWSLVVDPITNGIYINSHVVNNNVAYLTTWYNGHLVKTEDAGATWTEITSIIPHVGYIYGVSFPTTNIGIVTSGSQGKIVKTLDSGTTWNSIFPTSGNSFFKPKDIFASSVNDYIVVGENSQTTNNQKIYTTSDGGVNWVLTNAATSDLNDVHCTGANCYAVGKNGTIVTKTNTVLSVTDDVLNKEIKLFPNPTSGILYLNSNENYEITIFDLKGQTVLTTRTVEGKLDVSGLKDGLYLLRAKKNNQIVVSQKILID